MSSRSNIRVPCTLLLVFVSIKCREPRERMRVDRHSRERKVKFCPKSEIRTNPFFRTSSFRTHSAITIHSHHHHHIDQPTPHQHVGQIPWLCLPQPRYLLSRRPPLCAATPSARRARLPRRQSRAVRHTRPVRCVVVLPGAATRVCGAPARSTCAQGSAAAAAVGLQPPATATE